MNQHILDSYVNHQGREGKGGEGIERKAKEEERRREEVGRGKKIMVLWFPRQSQSHFTQVTTPSLRVNIIVIIKWSPDSCFSWSRTSID